MLIEFSSSMLIVSQIVVYCLISLVARSLKLRRVVQRNTYIAVTN